MNIKLLNNYNFRNNQNYILGKNEKKKVLSKFILENEFINLKNMFIDILKWSYDNQRSLFLIILSLLIIVFLGTNFFICLIILGIILLISGSFIFVIFISSLWISILDALEENTKIHITGIKSFFISKNVSKIKVFLSYYLLLIFLFVYFLYNKDIFYNYISFLDGSLGYIVFLKISFTIIISLIYFLIFFSFFKIQKYFSNVLKNIFSNKIRKILFFPFYINYFSILLSPFLIIYFFCYFIYIIITVYLFKIKNRDIKILKFNINGNILNNFKKLKKGIFLNKYYQITYKDFDMKSILLRNLIFINYTFLYILGIFVIYSGVIFLNTYDEIKSKDEILFRDVINPIIKLDIIYKNIK